MSPFPGADRYLANNFGVYPIDSATNAGNVCHVSYSLRKIRSSICLSQVLTTEAMSPFDLLNESYYSRGAQVSRGKGGGGLRHTKNPLVRNSLLVQKIVT